MTPLPRRLELDSRWPVELLPEGVIRMVQGAPVLWADHPTPLLLLNPDARWIIRPSPPEEDVPVWLFRHAPWRAPRLPGGPEVVLFRDMDSARRTGLVVRQEGMTPRYFPLLRFVFQDPPPDIEERLDQADVLVFTSPRGVEGVYRWLRRMGRPWPARRVVAIGPSTRRALEDRGCFPVEIPTRYSAEGLRDHFARMEVRGKTVVLFRSGGRSLLLDALRERGATVWEIPPYATLPYPTDRLEPFRSVLMSAHHWVFTSPSTVHHLMTFLGGSPPPSCIRCWAIGPATGEALRSYGMEVPESPVHTPEALIRWIQEQGAHHVSP